MPTAILSLVFFLSGFTALVYQVVWQRLLTLHYGVGAVSITLVVTVFMGGLGLGALLGGRLAGRVRNPLLIYAGIEFMIGLFGLASFWLLDALGRHTAGSHLTLAFFFIGAFLVVPTTLMGMTLPILTKIYNALVADFGLAVSQLYFVNTMGAAAGSLIAAYGLITFGGLDTALQVAAGINLLMGLLILACRGGPAAKDRTAAPPPGPVIRWLPAVVFVTGFLAIGYEIIWLRVLGVLSKESPYAFSTILSMYLAGIAFGSLAMSRRMARGISAAHREKLLYGMQAGIAAYVLASFLAFYWTSDIPPFKWLKANSFAAGLHPPDHWPPVSGLLEFGRALFVTVDIVFWPLLFVFIPALMMGATFPLVSVLSLRHAERDADTVARIYAWTILGNVLGGLVTGFALLPYLGTERTVLLFSVCGLAFLAPLAVRSGNSHPGPKTAVCAIAVLLAAGFFPGQGQLYEAIHPNFGFGTAHFEEGREGVVFTYANGERIHNVINGTLHGGRPNDGFIFEAIEALSHTPRAKRVLVIGYGTGEISDTLLLSGEIGELVIVELNHTLMANLRKIDLFSTSLSDPRIQFVMDDGRRYLNRNPGRFDAILMDPIYHHAVYSNNIYSRQFFELARAHLEEHGVLMVWSDEHHVIGGTIASAFPHIRRYGGGDAGTHGFYLASKVEMKRDPVRAEALLGRFEPAKRKLIETASSYSGDRSAVLRFGQGYPINEDWKPRAEYYLGLRR